METTRVEAISKVLSANDTGETGGHQAGICVPRGSDVLAFFPDLGNSVKNPRASMVFVDDWGQRWNFNFIYYNNRIFNFPAAAPKEGSIRSWDRLIE